MNVEPPNILIFMVDHGQSDVFRSDHPAITPNVERLAAEGVDFTEAYCPAAHCCPSRASFMTGLMPSQHGVFNNVSNSSAIHRGLAPGVTTFAEALADVGYQLTYCGKWHVSDETGPGDHGWRERNVTANCGSSESRRHDPWWKGSSSEITEERGRPWGELVTPGWGDYRLFERLPDDTAPADEIVVTAGLDALEEYSKQSDRPWCLFVGPIGPHDPYRVPGPFLDLYEPDTIPLPDSYRDRLHDKPNVYRRMREQLWDQLTEAEVRDAIRHYWAYCSYEDELFGQLLDVLDRTDSARNTLVLFTSDHGDYVGAHGLFLKGIPAFREAYNVPAIVRWPERVTAPGRRISALVSLADFAPTFLDIADARGEAPMTGRTLAPFFADDTPRAWRTALATEMNGVELYYSQRALITARWKFVYNGFDFDELYDRATDPHELRNLAVEREFASVVEQLTSQMWRVAEDGGDWMLGNHYATVRLAARGPMR